VLAWLLAAVALIATCALDLTACVTISEVAPMCNSEYTVTAVSTAGRAAADRAAALKTANQYCTSIGKGMIASARDRPAHGSDCNGCFLLEKYNGDWWDSDTRTDIPAHAEELWDVTSHLSLGGLTLTKRHIH
jgi:hypothetical protein